MMTSQQCGLGCAISLRWRYASSHCLVPFSAVCNINCSIRQSASDPFAMWFHTPGPAIAHCL